MKQILLALFLFLTMNMSAQDIQGSWIGKLPSPANLRLVFHIQKDSIGDLVFRMDSPDQSVNGILGSIEYISHDSLNVNINKLGINYQGSLQGDSIKGTFKQMGVSLPLNLKKGTIKYNRPQTPTPPFPYETQNVYFENTAANAKLAGTLTYPVGYKEGKKVPVVLMVTGSGPENRDSEIYGHKPFLVIADFLARHGIASLRYDDRNVGASTGTYQTMTTKDVADDAKCGIAYLRKNKDFKIVGLLGHSEGATVGFMLGSEKLIDFVISMAGPGVQGDEVLYSQSKKIVSLSGGVYPFSKEQYMKMVKQQKNPWIEYFIQYDPQENIRSISCPVLALNGNKDVQVISEINLKAIKENLSKNKKSKIIEYDGLNHLFQECKTGLPTEYANIEQTISPKVLEDIVSWISNLGSK